jgi:hypothetical protein
MIYKLIKKMAGKKGGNVKKKTAVVPSTQQTGIPVS